MFKKILPLLISLLFFVQCDTPPLPPDIEPTVVITTTVSPATVAPTATTQPTVTTEPTPPTITTEPTAPTATTEPTAQSVPTLEQNDDGQTTSPLVREFNLGTLDISTPLLGDAEIVSPLEGVIGLPDDEQAHPLIIILHGRHGICGNFVMEPYPCPEDMPEVRFDIGFGYLVEALAQQGYAAIAINLNAALTTSFGSGAINTRVQQLVDAHLASLQTASSDDDDTLYGTSLAGRIDFSQIGLVGHSAGGGAALSIIRQYEGKK